ncbi:MAG: hypothetical protein ACP5XB_24660 [Isosphaeraceae bacterium]
MADQRISIARVMMIIALVAANCALLREVSWDFLPYPTIWSGLGILNFLILWKLILCLPLRAAHYTFLSVFVPSYIILTNLAARELIHPTGPLIRLYQRNTGDTSQSVTRMAIGTFGDVWLATVMALLLALAGALLAGWLERRRGWDIAAFWRGVLVVMGLVGLFATLVHAMLEPPPGNPAQPPGSPLTYANLVGLAVCMIVGGRLGLSRFKSDLPRQEEIGTTTATPGLLADPGSAQTGDVESPDRA